MSARTAQDVWVVGEHDTAPTSPLILHWDGQRWHEESSPALSSGDLLAVAALSANNVWAVGTGFQTSTRGPVIEHYDGHRWQLVKALGLPASGVFNGIAARSAQDLWAVGENDDTYGTALVAHYDGHTWKSMPALSDPRTTTTLQAVAASSPNDVWVVGNVGDAVTPSRKIVEHWNGRQWRFVSDVPYVSDALLGISGYAANDVWAGGLGLLEHWDSTRWRQIQLPQGDIVHAVTAAGVGAVWVAGAHLDVSKSQQVLRPLVERFDLAHCTGS